MRQNTQPALQGTHRMEEIMKRTWLAAACTAALSLSMAIPAFAGQWQQNANGWWYSQDDGTYPSGGWYWIDQDLDKKAECYYFNQDGYCLMGLPAPDGGLTNASGAWIVNDVVQTQTVTAEVTKRNTFLGTYSGTYTASHGKGGIDIAIFETGDIQMAQINFYSLKRKDNIQEGSYLCQVKKLGTNTYELRADEWIYEPTGYSMLNWKLTLTDDVLEGHATSNSKYKLKVTKN